MTTRRVGLLSSVVFLAGCADLGLPDVPPPPGPGTVQGRVVYAVPGRSEIRAAAGAEIFLLNTSEKAVADAESGRFVIDGIRSRFNQLLIRFDADGDGTPERQRIIDLKNLGVGSGKDVELGDVSLGRNASLAGRVLRGDTPGVTGHSGTTVFVPGAPFFTTTADDGSFLLNDLPEGPVNVSFFHDGFELDARDTTLVGGAEGRLAAVTLAVTQTTPMPGQLVGEVQLEAGGPASGARIRAAASGMESTTTVGADGHFTFAGLRPALYQVAVELAGFASVRLYNVLVTPGDNALAPLTLVAGASEPVALDGGVPANDAGVALPVAFIDPSLVEEASGTAISLSGVRSAGVRPLTFHWSSDAGVSFAQNDSSSATLGQFTTPATSALFSVELEVTDALGRTSGRARSAIRVGKAPTVTLNGMGTVSSGGMVTLVGNAVSTDGRPIVAYRWRQVTGPFVPELALATSSTVTFIAPQVPAPTPLSVELVAETDLGFASAPVETTVVVNPSAGWDVQVTFTPASGGSYTADGGTVVRMTATVTNPPPDAGFTYSWTPFEQGCRQPDGGIDLMCSSAFVLSNPTARQTEFVSPRVDGALQQLNFDVTVTNLRDNSTRTKQVKVPIADARPPSCMPLLSPLAFRLHCDEPIGDAGTLSFMAGTPAFSLTRSTNDLVAQFALPASGMIWFALDGGISDVGGNTADFSMATISVSDNYSAEYVSSDTSTSEARPRWVSMPVPSSMSRTWLVGRRVDMGTDRSAWLMDATPGCLIGPQCPLPTQGINKIPGAGQFSKSPELAVVVNGRLFVGVSPNMPSHVVSITPNGMGDPIGAELMLNQDWLGFGVVDAKATVFIGTSLTRYEFDTLTSQFVAKESLSMTPDFNANAVVHASDLGMGDTLVAAISSTGGARGFMRSGNGPWSAFMPPGLPALAVTSIRAMLLQGSPFTTKLLFVESPAGAQIFGEVGGTTLTNPITLPGGTSEVDVARWGNSVLVVSTRGGQVFVSLFDPVSQTITPVSRNGGGTLFWNETGANAAHPSISVIDGQAAVAWDVNGTTYRMAGRLIR